jgi:hypothetical protein
LRKVPEALVVEADLPQQIVEEYGHALLVVLQQRRDNMLDGTHGVVGESDQWLLAVLASGVLSDVILDGFREASVLGEVLNTREDIREEILTTMRRRCLRCPP